MCICFFFVFFFKQKTAYEMRISDWSSDVCSSDLREDAEDRTPARPNQGRGPAIVEKPAERTLRRQKRAGRLHDGSRPSLHHHSSPRSEESRVGKECVSTWRSRWSPDH